MPVHLTGVDLWLADTHIKACDYPSYSQMEIRSTLAQQATLEADCTFQVTADPR